MNNKVVARLTDGRVFKGETSDFLPNKECFHVTDVSSLQGAGPVEVQMKDLKALFFVKSLEGNPGYTEQKEFNRIPMGRKIQVTFHDGEVLVGTTQGYTPGRPGFFIEPADAASNNERCYIVSAAASDVRFI
jgi:hypothetical protein